MCRRFAELWIAFLFVSVAAAADQPEAVLNISLGKLQPGMKVNLKISAEYNVVEMPGPNEKDHPFRPVPDERIKVRQSGDKPSTLNFVIPAPEIDGRQLKFKLPKDLNGAGENQYSAVVFRTEFTLNLKRGERDISGVANLATRWDPGEGRLVRCLRLDSTSKTRFQITLLNRCDEIIE